MSARPHTHERLSGPDALRGFALLWMTGFHLCFDLHYFGYLHTNFYSDPFWTVQRAAIVTLFVFCAGVSQAIACAQQQTWPRFWRRWLQIAGAALLVSAASYTVFAESYIYFGILHGLALMLLLTRWIAVRCAPASTARWLWPLGALALLLPLLAPALHAHWPAAEALNGRSLNWLGLISRKPITEDYAPLLPWLGVMLWGLACGRWWLERRDGGKTIDPLAAQAQVPGSLAVRALARLGRHSLAYYLLHQPVLLGVLAFISG